MSTTQELLDAAGPAWKEATSGPFLTAAVDGTLPKEAFDKWLFQVIIVKLKCPCE